MAAAEGESPRDGRRKKRPGIVRQKQIIAGTAVELFSEQGTANVAVAKICERAQVSRHTFYRCFVDKDELLSFIYNHAVNEHIGRAIDSLQMQSGEHDPGQLIGQVVDAILRHQQLAQFIYSEARVPGSTAYRLVDDAYEHVAAAVQRWFQRELGVIPERSLLKAIMAATQWLLQDAMHQGLNDITIEQAKTGVGRLFEGLYLSMARQAQEMKHLSG